MNTTGLPIVYKEAWWLLVDFIITAKTAIFFLRDSFSHFLLLLSCWDQRR